MKRGIARIQPVDRDAASRMALDQLLTDAKREIGGSQMRGAIIIVWHGEPHRRVDSWFTQLHDIEILGMLERATYNVHHSEVEVLDDAGPEETA